MKPPTRKKTHAHTVPANPAAALAGLITKRELASLVRMSTRGIELLVRRRAIPAVKIGRRCIRFDPAAVLRALDRLTVREVQ